MKRFGTKQKRFLCFALLLVCVCGWLTVIFGSSAKTGTVSAAQSDKVVEIVRPVASPILEAVHVDPTNDNLSFLVRKSGHFLEFAMLGMLSALCVWAFPSGKKVRFCISYPFCVLIAFCDEWVQLFSEGRSGRLADVLLDSTGALFGTACIFLVMKLVHRKSAKRMANLTKKEAETE